MRILTVIGTRPQFIKYAALAEGIRERFSEVLVDTGQHYDHALAQGILDGFGIGEPNYRLCLEGRGPLEQVGIILPALDEIVTAERPDAVLCFGDTNSTLAAALAALKREVPLLHVEAGERNFTTSGQRVHPRLIPEEANRVMVDHVASLLLCASTRAEDNLRREAVQGKIVYTGDITYDLYLRTRARMVHDAERLAQWQVTPGEYHYCTVHRALNTDSAPRLAGIVEALLQLELPVVLPLHPRTRKMLQEFGLLERLHAGSGLRLVDPVGYADSVCLNHHSHSVITDSGGVIREAFFNQVVSVFLDDTTEWLDIMETGWSIIAGADTERILQGVRRAAPAEALPLFGDGNAVARTLEALERCAN